MSEQGNLTAVCQRCGMVLNQYIRLTGQADQAQVIWIHGGPADHEPEVAMPGSAPRLYCDFCSAPDPESVIDTDRDFTIVSAGADGMPVTENFNGSWAACHVCADLFRRQHMQALLDRSVAALGPLSRAEHRAYRDQLARIHAGFLASGPHPPRPASSA
jgi:hypothetical protein